MTQKQRLKAEIFIAINPLATKKAEVILRVQAERKIPQ